MRLMPRFANRLSLTWVFLSAITILSWRLGAAHAGHPFQHDRMITAAVIGLALVKVRFIMREFMDVRTAPNSIKWISDAWLVAVFAALMTAYSLA